LLLLRVAPVSLRSGKKPHRGGFSAFPRGRGRKLGGSGTDSQPLPAAAMPAENQGNHSLGFGHGGSVLLEAIR